MKKYRVIFTQTEHSYIEVEAHNKTEALEKANAEWENGNDGELLSQEMDTKTQDITARLEYLRGEIEAERISYGEINELQSLAEYIEPGDNLLLEWAGVAEN
jgi:hypothetical protein